MKWDICEDCVSKVWLDENIIPLYSCIYSNLSTYHFLSHEYLNKKTCMKIINILVNICVKNIYLYIASNLLLKVKDQDSIDIIYSYKMNRIIVIELLKSLKTTYKRMFYETTKNAINVWIIAVSWKWLSLL